MGNLPTLACFIFLLCALSHPRHDTLTTTSLFAYYGLTRYDSWDTVAKNLREFFRRIDRVLLEGALSATSGGARSSKANTARSVCTVPRRYPRHASKSSIRTNVTYLGIWNLAHLTTSVLNWIRCLKHPRFAVAQCEAQERSTRGQFPTTHYTRERVASAPINNCTAL